MSETQAKAGVARRELLGGAALLGLAGAVGIARMLPRLREPHVLVFDGARPASRAFSRTAPALARIDLVQEARTNWRGLRALAKGAPVAGLTAWSAYVGVRGLLQEKGLRLVSETLDARSGLVAWTMA